MSERMPRKNSVWRHKETGTEVYIIGYVRDYGVRATSGYQGTHIIAFGNNNDDGGGGLELSEEDFKEKYDWVRGRR